METNTNCNNEEIKEENEKQYCIFCGTEYTSKEITCKKCGKELEVKENLLVEFLIDKTKDKFKGNIEDSLSEAIINFIKSHLYGFILTISIVSVLVTNVIANDTYIQKVTHEPGKNTIVLKNNYSDAQLEVKEAVDSYFYYARNVDGLSNASKELEPLLSPQIEVQITSEYSITSTYNVEEIKNIDSAEYVYSIIDSNCVQAPTAVSEKFYEDGYKIAEVVLYETLYVDSIKREDFFLITLMQQNGKWTINEAISLANDPKDAMYIEEYLYAKAYDYFDIYMRNDMNEEEKNKLLENYILPKKYGFAFTSDIMNTDENVYYVVYEPEQSVLQESSLTKAIRKKGYPLAQTILKKQIVEQNEEVSEESYVITFVNVDGMWYIAEIVEDTSSDK